VRCLQLLDEGKSPTYIMKLLKRSSSFVYKTNKNRKNVYTCQTKTRTGRPKKLTSNAKRIIRKSRGKKNGSTRKLVKKIKDVINLHVSPQTIHNFQKAEGQFPYRRKKVPLLTAKNIETRTKFVKKYGTKSQCFWDNWIFTDEKYFGLSERSNSKNDVIWADNPDDVPNVATPKHDGKVMVWGGITSKGLTKLIVFDQNEKIDSQKYLEKVLIPTFQDIKSRKKVTNDLITTKLFSNLNNWTYQQDGATAHTANNIQEWLSNNSIKFIAKEEWPGNSPDLNPIENLWAIMETKLYENGPIESLELLNQKLQEVWRSTTLSTLTSLARSMKKRLKSIQNDTSKKAEY